MEPTRTRNTSRHPKGPKPGELRARGVRAENSLSYVEIEGGLGVTPEQVEFFSKSFLESRVTALNAFMRHPLEPAFVDELRARGYDLATFKFSIYLAESAPPLPKRLRLIGLRPGVLQSRWAKVEHCTADTCTSWAKPCDRADSRFVLGFMSTVVYEKSGHPLLPRYSAGMNFTTNLKALGFDVKSMRLSVKIKTQES